VSDRSSEGNQFVKGFGGIGAILRYKVNFEQLVDVDDEDEFYDGMLDGFGFLTSNALLTDLRRLTITRPRRARGRNSRHPQKG
jgi:peptide chain release factor subunit 1